MTGESEVAGVWAALFSLALLIAVTLTAGYWFCIYRDEARIMQPFFDDEHTTLRLIWEDVSWPK